ncbi:hypothetical protein ZIOFF_064472 [Zingiber officinale]|uniref:DUF4219 domain-containing protein n=1 Tax=Zingiber officinale TaxID=94328 RepID=A0A8J5EVZ7_ZINOF|nr:hypothetical protein ZIOFF_064472 [Zingiber officinale]
MKGTSHVAGLGLELLNQSNYRIWKTCMESYLVGEDLWDVVSTNGVVAPANITENVEAFKKWKQQNAKAEFVLKRTISHGIFEHVIRCSNYAKVTRLQEELSLRFDMKKLGELKNFLGLQIENLEQGICVSQFNYAKRLIEKFGLIDGKKRSTPLDVSARLRCDEGTCLSDPRPFRALVGSLIYLTITRPDIAFSVGIVSRYMQEPWKPHFEEAKNILKYVNSTLNLGLFYKKGVEFSLQGFVDTDFSGDLDDQRSTSGFVFMCATTSISWCSKKQGSVSLSTIEA